MAKDLSDVELDDLSERQEKLMLWHDYFDLLIEGLVVSPRGDSTAWTEEEVKIITHLRVLRNECASDAMHLECGQEENCRFDEPKDLQAIAINMQ